MTIKSPKSLYYVYPDASVVCGQIEVVKVLGVETITNPIVVFEVLSNEPEYDLNEKRLIYQAIPSLREYIFLWQDEPKVIHYRRESDNWIVKDLLGISAVIDLSSINVDLSFTEIYDGVIFS